MWSRSILNPAWAMVLAGTVGMPAGSAWGGPVGPTEPARLRVPSPMGLIDFEVDQPERPRSLARVHEPDVRVAGASGSFELAARLIVDADMEVVRRLVGLRGRVRSGPVPGFVIVETPSIVRAVRLADRLMRAPGVGSVELDLAQPRAERFPSDPSFGAQWHLHNFTLPAADVNAVPAWELGYTGLGVVVGVIELSFQPDHPDLANNFMSESSMPSSVVTSHATSVAGVIAADNDNGLGGVGMAYDAGLSRLIYGTSAQTAEAFTFRNDLNDIKNNSWGPLDNGRISYMSAIERAALSESVAEGRGGLGEIFVWAAGNGGLADRVDYDPYASSRYTIAVGAVGDLNFRATYNEVGSSMFVVTHSSGNIRRIFSTDSNGTYTSSFGGTSAAAPLASGVIALMLQANPQLSWRDVQQVLAETAWQVDPTNASWQVNAGGRHISEHYGFGAIDAEAAVLASRSWVSLPDEVHADSGVIVVERAIADNDPTGVTISSTLDSLIRVESVEVIVNVDTTNVGDLRVVLTAPSGTRSVLATPRNDTTDHYVDYVFTSVRHWGESSAGVWTVTISDEQAGTSAFWRDVRVVAHGVPWSYACPADLDGDGVLSAHDVQAFLAAYHGLDPLADFQPDGIIDYYDLQRYLNLLGEGCP